MKKCILTYIIQFNSLLKELKIQNLKMTKKNLLNQKNHQVILIQNQFHLKK